MRRTVWKPSEMAESGYDEAGHCGASSRSYSSPRHHEGDYRGQRYCACRMVTMSRVYRRDSLCIRAKLGRLLPLAPKHGKLLAGGALRASALSLPGLSKGPHCARTVTVRPAGVLTAPA